MVLRDYLEAQNDSGTRLSKNVLLLQEKSRVESLEVLRT